MLILLGGELIENLQLVVIREREEVWVRKRGQTVGMEEVEVGQLRRLANDII